MFFWLLGICDAADDKHKWCRLRSNHRNSNHDRWQLSYRFFYRALSPLRAARRISRRANSKICIEAINSINEHSRQSRARALHIHLIIFMSIFSRYFSDWLKKKFQGIYWSACVEVLFFFTMFRIVLCVYRIYFMAFKFVFILLHVTRTVGVRVSSCSAWKRLQILVRKHCCCNPQDLNFTNNERMCVHHGAACRIAYFHGIFTN